MNIEALQMGPISQMIQLKDYNYHLKAIQRIKNNPSEYKEYTRPRHYEGVIKKSKKLAVTFDKKEWSDAVESKNVWLLGNISRIKNGDYKTFITKKGEAKHKLKSLRKESINKEQHRIVDENAKLSNRLGFVNSTIQAHQLLRSSSET